MVTLTGSTRAADELLLDDFADRDGRSAFGTRWNGFTDRVMGGRSDMQSGVVDTDDGPALRMRGSVRLENNGGFIQVRLPLTVDGETLDGSGFDGVRLQVRGASGPYYVHIRTPDCRRPWQYYRAELPVTSQWREVFVPFSAFEGESIRGTPDFGNLSSIALAAFGEAFEAELEVRHLALARDQLATD